MNKLVLIVSTNALLVGGLLILAGVYGAARWYFNVELGWLPWVIAAFLAAIVNIWILRHQSDSKQKEK